MDDAVMATVALDDGGSIAILVFGVLGVLGAFAAVRLVLRAYFAPETR
jgi:hypothetical protein